MSDNWHGWIDGVEFTSRESALKALGISEPAPAEQGEERLKASEVHLRAVQRACEILDAIPFNKSIADLRWAGRRLYIECKRLAARPQPKEPQAEASGENATVAKIGEIIIAYHEDSENWDQAIYHIRLALRECIPRPAPTDEKALRAPRGDGSGGWTLDYGYLNLIAETMNQEFRVGMEEIEAVILAHEAPKDGA